MASSWSGAGRPSSAKEDADELVVEMLPGVHEHLLIGLAQSRRHRRCLYELRPVTDDGEDLQSPVSSDSIRAFIALRRRCS